MRLYQAQHRAYCGVDLHARTMFLCVLDRDGRTLLHQDIPTTRGGRCASRPVRRYRGGGGSACALRSDDTEADWSEAASVDQTDARNAVHRYP